MKRKKQICEYNSKIKIRRDNYMNQIKYPVFNEFGAAETSAIKISW